MPDRSAGPSAPRGRRGPCRRRPRAAGRVGGRDDRLVELTPPTSMQATCVGGDAEVGRQAADRLGELRAGRQLLDHHGRRADHGDVEHHGVVGQVLDLDDRHGPCSRTAASASRRPMYGSPPPPVPSTAAPRARAEQSSPISVIGRTVGVVGRVSAPGAVTVVVIGPAPEREVTDGLGADACGVAGQVRDRDLVEVHDRDAGRVRAGGDGTVDRFLRASSTTADALAVADGVDLVDLARDLGDRGADGVGHGVSSVCWAGARCRVPGGSRAAGRSRRRPRPRAVDPTRCACARRRRRRARR